MKSTVFPEEKKENDTKKVEIKKATEPKEIRYGSFLVGNGNCTVS